MMKILKRKKNWPKNKNKKKWRGKKKKNGNVEGR